MATEITAHDVTAIELVSTFQANGNSRRIRITTASGVCEITLYGETDVLEALPKSDDFHALHFPQAKLDETEEQVAA